MYSRISKSLYPAMKMDTAFDHNMKGGKGCDIYNSFTNYYNRYYWYNRRYNRKPYRKLPSIINFYICMRICFLRVYFFCPTVFATGAKFLLNKDKKFICCLQCDVHVNTWIDLHWNAKNSNGSVKFCSLSGTPTIRFWSIHFHIAIVQLLAVILAIVLLPSMLPFWKYLRFLQ